MLCRICETPLTGRKRETCSKPCRVKLDGIKRRESGRLLKKNMTPEQLARKAARDTRWRHRYKTWSCVTCDSDVTVGNVYKAGYWCSLRCKYSYWAAGIEASKSKAIQVKEKTLPTVEINVLRGGWWTAGECKVCGDLFISPYADKTCSPQCQRINDPNRDWIDTPTRYVIYERDKWICHLCGGKVPRHLEYSHDTYQPNYPSLDHVIPRSQGGDDTPDNLKLAHVHCNTLRGVTPV